MTKKLRRRYLLLACEIHYLFVAERYHVLQYLFLALQFPPLVLQYLSLALQLLFLVLYLLFLLQEHLFPTVTM